MAESSQPSWQVECHDVLSSTSDYCKERAEQGPSAPLAVLALTQTKARGSRGRSWTEPKGNLAFSVLLWPQGGSDPTIWPFISALAFYEALAAHAERNAPLSIKWPNDILLNGMKLGGILIERGAHEGREWVVIGFGANLVQAPIVPGRVLACLADAGFVGTPHDVATSLRDSLDHWMGIWSQSGFAPIRQAWLDRAHPIGTALAVRRDGYYAEGSFAGLDDCGFLLLDTHDGVVRISTGDILLLN